MSEIDWKVVWEWLANEFPGVALFLAGYFLCYLTVALPQRKSTDRLAEVAARNSQLLSDQGDSIGSILGAFQGMKSTSDLNDKLFGIIEGNHHREFLDGSDGHGRPSAKAKPRVRSG